MSYQVLARKWRPQRFADVLGQEHITRTLQNAIQTSRVGHAYLFVGPRGIGKTTSARIFAKALNCSNPQADTEGRIEPCCECQACIEIAACSCLDVIEIDGASHNKVEDVREICENVQYSPTNGRQYKIYIIDEVHMLTTQAWNALLKTLEEPPEHVKFLFATTEAHKVLATILSRTQRFDLKRIPASVIVARLRDIATKEGVFIDDDALRTIARAAEGGMRDAQSIFDQMIAFCGGMTAETTISESGVIDVFGMTSQGELRRIEQAMLTNDAGTVIDAIHNLADKGRDLEKLYGDLLQGLRNIMVFQVVSDAGKILEITASEAEELGQMAQGASPQLVQRLVEGMLSYGDQIRHTLNKRVFLEVTLLKVMQDAHAVQVDDLISVLRKFKETGSMPDLPPISPGALTQTLPPKPTSNPKPLPPGAPPLPALVSPQPEQAPEAAPAAKEVQVAPAMPAPEPVIPVRPEPITSPASVEPAAVPTPTEPVFEQPVEPANQAPSQETCAAPMAPPEPLARQHAAAPPQSVDRTQLASPINTEEAGAEQASETKRAFQKGAEVIENVRQNEFVKKVCDMFDGQVIDARA